MRHNISNCRHEEDIISSTEVILVSVDGSTGSLATVEWTADRGTRAGARIHCLCTYALVSYSAVALGSGYAVLDDEALKAGAEQVVEEAKALARGRGAAHVSGSAEPRDSMGIPTDFSAEADMIVVGSRGDGGLADRLLGTISSTLPAHTRYPVVVVPRHVSGKKFTPVERVVVGIDGTDQPSCALKRAIGGTCLWDAHLTMVSAVPIAVGPSVMTWTPAGVDHSALLVQVREGMDAAIATVLGGGDVRVSRHALDGSAASPLIEFSTAVDLVVVDIRGRGGLAGVLLGSTSQTVLGYSICPIMIIPSAHLGDAGAVVHTEQERR